MQETWVRFLSREDPLEKEMATTPVFLPGRRSLAGYSPRGSRVGHDWATLLTATTDTVPTSGKVCDLRSGLPEPHLDFSWSQDSCSTKTFCFAATMSKKTSDWELRGWGSTLASLLGPLRPLTTGTSVLEPLNFLKAFSSCHLVGLLRSSPGEYHYCLEDEENKALALSCPQLQQTEAERSRCQGLWNAGWRSRLLHWPVWYRGAQGGSSFPLALLNLGGVPAAACWGSPDHTQWKHQMDRRQENCHLRSLLIHLQ